MKRTVVFNCYKIAASVNLQPIAEFFHLAAYRPAVNYLLLLPEQLESVLKHQAPGKYVWIFKSGSICLVNLDTAETYRLLKHLETIGLKPDLELFAAFNELHTLELAVSADPTTISRLLLVYATVLAKSTELKKLETMIDLTVDRSERFILELQKGFSDPTKAGFFQTNLAIIQLQLTAIHTLKILDRPVECYHETALKISYDAVARDYELTRSADSLSKAGV
jgi:uncharacterized Rmd1/YagE family protein